MVYGITKSACPTLAFLYLFQSVYFKCNLYFLIEHTFHIFLKCILNLIYKIALSTYLCWCVNLSHLFVIIPGIIIMFLFKCLIIYPTNWFCHVKNYFHLKYLINSFFLIYRNSFVMIISIHIEMREKLSSSYFSGLWTFWTVGEENIPLWQI